METLVRFRQATVKYTLLLTVIGAAALWPLNIPAAKGLLMGGIAGVLGFWINAFAVQKLASSDPDKITFTAVKWTFVRLFFYALAIYRSYTLDTERYYGMIAAVLGVFLVKFVMITVAFANLDKNRRRD
ncbi:MAG: ATP synthase subunit I [Candidatus Hydrogenedentes bacterium]|nr:ATP synthase subunit I [Candidatus Hydrogenedentota bacterium]